MAGTKPAWVTTEQTSSDGLGRGPSGQGSRRLGYEYVVHPDRIKRFGVGEAAVLSPGSRTAPTIARIHFSRR